MDIRKMPSKFRGWIKEKNQYMPQKQVDQLFIRMDGRVFWHSYKGLEDVTDKIDIEFSIGRFDKQRTDEFPEGQEIYQGDICKYSIYMGALQKFPVRHMVWVWSDAHCGFAMIDIRGKDYGYVASLIPEEHEIEVIGTIHDNPAIENRKT